MNKTQSTKTQTPADQPLWTEMTPADFDAKAKPVQGALFAEPDRCGTPDLFADWA